MTRAMRWRVGAFTIVGTFALGASFVGCGGDDDDQPPVTEDSGVDTAVAPDTKDGSTSETTPDAAEGGTDTSEAGDTAPPPPDRQVNIVFGQPDAKPLFVCLGAFAGDPTTADKPVQAIGPAGIPDTAAPTDPTKYKGFGFGSVLPFPVTTAEAKAALTSLTVVAYFVESNPLTATPAKKCEDVWKETRDAADGAKRWFKVAPNTIKAGESHVLGLVGCANPSTSPVPAACGTGTTDNREFVFQKLDTAAPAAGAFAAQFIHLSAFPGVAGAAPSFQNIDVYIQPMKPGTATDAGGDTLGVDALADAAPSPEPAGTLIALGGVGGTGLNFKDLVTPQVAVTLPAGTDPNLSFYVLTKHGDTPCLGGPSATCASYTLPAKTYLDLYKGAGAGWTAGTHQLMFLLGSAVPPTGTTTPVIIMGEANSKAGW